MAAKVASTRIVTMAAKPAAAA
ncbi:MAG: hypothetical protein JWO31_3269, partial [Phycisphaerales bacterium]|nr:hypothetical protein [Phycisphaerales bacterium]